MGRFVMGGLADWEPLAVGELLDFRVVGNFRAVAFDLIADRQVAVYAVSPVLGERLVAVGFGLMAVSFSASEDCAVSVVGDPDAAIYVRGRVKTQLMPESGDASFTRIEPRQTGTSDEVRRMMVIMRLNAERREAALRGEFEARLAAREAPPPDAVVEPEPPAEA